MLQKLFHLLREPGTLAWRLSHKLEVTLDRYQPGPSHRFDNTCDQLNTVLCDAIPGFSSEILEDPALTDLENEISSRLAEQSPNGTFAAAHNGDRTLGRLCYAACRALHPEQVVETGVAHGVTTAYILFGLSRNGRGHLRSIDLPPLSRNADDLVGIAVPSWLRTRWTLYRGATRQQLPIALREAGEIDVFVHDSLHTYRTMRWEFERALARMRRPGVLISDDVEGNRAFEDMVTASSPAKSSVILESNKRACCGLAFYTGTPPS